MSLLTGSQVILCDYPVRFDTYAGCTHACSYCFVKKWSDITMIRPTYSRDRLLAFIGGKRTRELSWVDWNIPLHWGGVSDPFQPAEELHGCSLDALKVFAGTQYPVIISTKGIPVVTKPAYLEQLRKCNVALQVSAIGPSYDKYEPGAVTHAERLAAFPLLAKNVKRLIVRIQPYVPGMRDEVAALLPKYAAAGVWGVTLEGMKTTTKAKGFVRVAGDFVPDLALLKPEVLRLRETAHKVGLKFYCAENRLRALGDSPQCCGVDGMEGFAPNTANLCHLGPGETIEYRPRMCEVGTADCFKTMAQTTAAVRALHEISYRDAMEIAKRSVKFREVMGLPPGIVAQHAAEGDGLPE